MKDAISFTKVNEDLRIGGSPVVKAPRLSPQRLVKHNRHSIGRFKQSFDCLNKKSYIRHFRGRQRQPGDGGFRQSRARTRAECHKGAARIGGRAFPADHSHLAHDFRRLDTVAAGEKPASQIPHPDGGVLGLWRDLFDLHHADTGASGYLILEDINGVFARAFKHKQDDGMEELDRSERPFEVGSFV